MADEYDAFFSGEASVDPYDAFFGVEPASVKPNTDRSLIGTLGDIGTAAAKTVVGTGEAAVGVLNIPTFGHFGKALQDGIGYDPKRTQEELSSGYSDAQQAAQARAAEGKGFIGSIQSHLENPSTILTGIGESVGPMLLGGAVGKGVGLATKAPAWLLGGVGEGVVGAGSAAEQIRQGTEDGTLSGRQVLSALGSGVGTGALGVLGGKIANSKVGKSLGLGDIDTALISGSRELAEGATQRNILSRVLGGAVSEGLLEELPQSVQEQMWQNFATDRPIMEGVPESAGVGLLLGAAMGGGFNAATRQPPAPTPKPTDAELDQGNAALTATGDQYEGAVSSTPLLGYTPEPIVAGPPGSLADAAGTAQMSGAAEAVRPLGQNAPLKAYQTTEAAQDYIAQQKDPELYTVIRHPRAKAGFAVVPKQQTEIDGIMAGRRTQEQTDVRTQQLAQEEEEGARAKQIRKTVLEMQSEAKALERSVTKDTPVAEANAIRQQATELRQQAIEMYRQVSQGRIAQQAATPEAQAANTQAALADNEQTELNSYGLRSPVAATSVATPSGAQASNVVPGGAANLVDSGTGVAGGGAASIPGMPAGVAQPAGATQRAGGEGVSTTAIQGNTKAIAPATTRVSEPSTAIAGNALPANNAIEPAKVSQEAPSNAPVTPQQTAQQPGEAQVKQSRRRQGETQDEYLYRVAAEKNQRKAEVAKANQPTHDKRALPTRDSDTEGVRRVLKDKTAETVRAEDMVNESESKDEISRQQAQFIAQVARLFKKRVVFFKSAKGTDGYYQGDDNTVYLNTRSTVAHLRVLGHELTHAMKQQVGDAYSKMLSAVSNLLTDKELSAHFEDYFGGALTDMAALDQPMSELTELVGEEFAKGGETLREFLIEEWMSDLAGNRFGEAAFWDELFQEIQVQHGNSVAKNIINRLRMAFNNALNKILQVLKGGEFTVDQRLQDHLLQIRAAVKEGFVAYEKAAKAGQLQEGAGVKFGTRFAPKRNVIEESIRTADTSSVILGTKPGNFDWKVDSNLTPPPIGAPVQRQPNQARIGQMAGKILSSKGARELFAALGIGSVTVKMTRGSWLGQPEYSYVITGMDFAGADLLAKLLGFSWAQDMAIATEAIANPALGTDINPGAALGTGKKLTENDLQRVLDAARSEGLDYTVATDGYSVRFGYGPWLGMSESSWDQKIVRIAAAAGMRTENYASRAKGNFANEGAYEDALRRIRQDGGKEGRDDPAAGTSDLFRRTADHLIVPYAKAVGAEGYRFDVERFAGRFGLTKPEAEYIRAALRPKRGLARSTAAILRGTEILGIGKSDTRNKTTAKANNTDVLWALQNRAAETGLIEPGDFSPEAQKAIAEALADEVIYHIAHAGKSAIGWYDAALKRAMTVYHRVFPELKTDPGKAMVFKALLGITSQGNDVRENSKYAARIYYFYRQGYSISEIINSLIPNSFGKQSPAITFNLHKLERLLNTMGAEKAEAFFNEKALTGAWNKRLRETPALANENGAPPKINTAAGLDVTGWFVFGPKIGSFINNLYGDYSTLTADLWFSRTWNRILGYSFINAPAKEQTKWQNLIKALKAERENDTSQKNAQGHQWLHGKDVAELSDEEFEEVINNADSAYEYAEELFRRFEVSGFKEKSDARRAAKGWLELREKDQAAPRSVLERLFQQRTVEQVQRLVRNKIGENVSIADIQAALWYYEKDLFKFFGASNKKSEAADYADAAAKMEKIYAEGDLFYNEKPEKTYIWGDKGSYLDGTKLSTARPNAASAERAGGSNAANGVKVYGTPSSGSVRVQGFHYSGAQRQELDGRYFGTAYAGRESARVAAAKDARIKERICFYVDAGKGVTPESGVGPHLHTVNLNNVYDANKDTFVQDTINKDQANEDWLNAFESAVIDAGFDGYVSDFANQRAAVLLGRHSVPVTYLGQGATPNAAPVAKAAAQETDADRVAKVRSLPMGQMPGSDWKRMIPAVVPGADVSMLDDAKGYYKDDVAQAMRAGSVKRSTVRALGNTRVIENPMRYQAENLLAKSQDKVLRGVRSEDGTLYLWDAYDAHHNTIIKHLGEKDSNDRLIIESLDDMPEGVFSGEPGYRSVIVNNAGSTSVSEGSMAEFEAAMRAVKKSTARTDRTNIDTAMRRMNNFVAEFEAGKMKDSDTQVLGTTPTVLRALGAKPLLFQIDGATVRKVLNGKHSFDITAAMLRQVPEGLYDPLLVFDSDRGQGQVVVTELASVNGKPVVAAVHFNKAHGGLTINDVASVYEKSDAEKAMTGWIGKGLLRYARNENDLSGTATRHPLPASVAALVKGRIGNVLQESDIVQQYGNKFSTARIVGDSNRAYTPEQAGSFKKLGREVTVPTLKERIAGLWKDAGKKLAQGLVDQFAPIKALSAEAYNLLRLSKGASGAFEVMLKGGQLKLEDGVYNFDDMKRGGFIDRLLKPLNGEADDFLWWVAGKRAEGLAIKSAQMRHRGATLLAEADSRVDAAKALEIEAKAMLQQAGDFSKNMTGNQNAQKENAKQANALLAQAKALRNEAAELRNTGNELKNTSLENLFDQDDIKNMKSLADGDTTWDYTLQNGTKKGQTTRNRAEIYADANLTFTEFNKNALDMAEQSGLIDKDSRAIWESQFYVPFYRVSEEDDAGVRGMNVKSGAVRQQAFKKLKGGTDKLNSDLLENTLMNMAHLLDAAAKNRAAKASIEAAEAVGAATQADSQDKNTVWFMDKGTKRYSRVEDPYVLAAIQGLEFAGMRGPMMDAMSKMKYALTIGVTASPFFKVRNLIRDSVQAIGTSGLSYNVGKNLKEGWKLTKQDSDAYFRLLAGGGTIHFGTMMEGSESKRIRALAEAGIDTATILDSESKIKAFYTRKIEPYITAYNEIGNRGEAINRASLYDQLIKQGKTHAEASIAARDLMDFSMQGAWTSVRFLTQVVPFMNARLQGMYKLGRAAHEDPRKLGMVIGAVALASIALMLAYEDDDDWKQREDWDRENYWWFKVGGEAFRIPKPFEIGAIGTIAERGVELFASDEMTGKRFMERMYKITMDNLSMNPMPQMFKPLLDIYANKDSHTNRPIETMGMEKQLPEYRFTANTSMTARAISTATKGVVGSPVQIDHLIRGYFSWLGTFVVATADVAARPLTDQPDRPSMDIAKTFSGGMIADLNGASSRYVSQMYDQAKTIEQVYGTYRALLREGKTEEAKELFADNQDKMRKYAQVEHIKKAVAKINEQTRRIERSAFSSEVKREQIDKLRERKDKLARMFAPV